MAATAHLYLRPALATALMFNDLLLQLGNPLLQHSHPGQQALVVAPVYVRDCRGARRRYSSQYSHEVSDGAGRWWPAAGCSKTCALPNTAALTMVPSRNLHSNSGSLPLQGVTTSVDTVE